MRETPTIKPNRRPWLRTSVILMCLAILAITGFQAYWLKNNYDREKLNLELKTNTAFRQTILRLQSSKLRFNDVVWVDSTHVKTIKTTGKKPKKMTVTLPDRKEPPISIIHLIQQRMRDSLKIDSLGNKSIALKITMDSNGRVMFDSGRRKKPVITYHKLSDSSLPIRELAENEGGRKGQRIVTYDYEKSIISRDSMILNEQGRTFGKALPMVNTEEVLGGMPEPGRENGVFRFLYDIDSLSIKDSVTVREIDSAYAKRLKEEKLDVDFNVERLDSGQVVPPDAVTIGFMNAASFDLSLLNTSGYILGRLKLPILFSVFLVGLTILSFVMLYRSMLRQQRLADLKNDFISNITHELKTPIATVGVAIEALKNFNAIDDPQRTREYLDISQQELHRLNLLVDKVLKLSMFEKKEIELKYETIRLHELVEEVVSSLRLQIEKFRARVTVRNEGDTTLQGDRLHLLSVIFNLVDNALKYSGQNPEINILLKGSEENIILQVMDNGIGIPQQYREKVFEKFFRIPHGDTHNAKGYGLGLSYTAHVVKKHAGSITVGSNEENQTVFTITLPKNPANVDSI
jgi:two-component system phosphate regulon sensor histidine kinase PhoR